MRTGLNQLTMRSVPYYYYNYLFIFLQTNAFAKYGADLEKNELERTGEAEIRTSKKFWH